MHHIRRLPSGFVIATASLLVMAACGGGSNDDTLPRLAPATPAGLDGTCDQLADRLVLTDTVIDTTATVPAGDLTVGGQPVPAHCLVTGRMHERTSAVDSQPYAIGFEMRLPVAWNGRFFHQGNGGLDGSVVQATGAAGGGPLTHALHRGFAVLSSDAGHSAAQNPVFGLDPQARLDYGYQAVAKLTPMARQVIATAYGKAPDRSYFGGCSNGGRHTFVAAARYADQYDGFLAGAPGYRLPRAAIANIFGAQRYASVATDPTDLSTAFTADERSLVAERVLAKCDALDGAEDGMVQDTSACQAAFSLADDVPTCTGARDGSCLSAAQKTAIAPIFSGAVSSSGAAVYASFPYDSGLASPGVAFWEFTAPLVLDSSAIGFVFQVPPQDPAGFNGPAFALSADIDALVAAVSASNGTYTEPAMSFMTPPDVRDLSTLRNRGAKMMVYHGVSDPIFSVDDTQAWYDGLQATHDGKAAEFARFYRVPGMGHCSGGPSTDQFDMLGALVDWVERGIEPHRVVASARGAGNAGGANPDVPAGWAADRTRPLCPYPRVARYLGTGSIEDAENFECR
ncbi:tannase/feruloyl esterase family alpha/beta hydrolase [Schlegelella sp. S2-27]|uniref:Tannase/feruloyl esterase family alpha/beta hydrolase n=1 Tax=Caldimonas mangrovi TaxID=2944811 RepID=A0ABT0YWM2_9BURK|nr:tannase/feruloyl esterase family alpha/beta hydrolase [Caldimonas mangrovi]MCM5682772.1 tannase/feruloyl esterase family alpha/beta hydrolase [Caldimonas mangrovi]